MKGEGTDLPYERIEAFSPSAHGLRGGLLADLTNHVRFPNSPDLVERVGQFESTPNWGDSDGARLSGWLIPPTTGNYKFYLASDDQGALFLSTDATPANKVQIAAEPQWNGYREYIIGANQSSRSIPPVNISTNIPLIAGRAYYVEALLKEGVQGDHLSVAWLPPGGPAITNGAAPINGRYLASGIPPTGPLVLLSTASLTNSSRVTVRFDRLVGGVGATAAIFTTATGSGLLKYQWRFNGTNIAGATNGTLVLRNVQPSEAGDDRVVVSNLDGLINSLPARLTVIQTVVLSAELRADTGGLILNFNGPPGQRYQIEFSQDLKVWLPVLNITNTTGSTQVQLPTPDDQKGFYRAVFMP